MNNTRDKFVAKIK